MSASNHEMELMRKARAGASFDSKQLSLIIYGGSATTSLYCPNTLTRHAANVSGLLGREYPSDGSIGCGQVLREEHKESPVNASAFKSQSMAFILTIRAEGSEQQKKFWLPLAESGKIIGTCAQAELGHWTFLRGLETVSYIPMLSVNTTETFLRQRRMIKRRMDF